jgi:hypothetical protein
MSTSNDQKAELLGKTIEFYRRSIANYTQFVKTEKKPRTKKQLEQRMQAIMKELEALKPETAQ